MWKMHLHYSVETNSSMNSQSFTFDQLRQMNISTDQLLAWYAPLDIIEDYVSGKVNRLFFNCSDNGNLWFGAQCEYTFDTSTEFHKLVLEKKVGKMQVPEDILAITNGTCYITDPNVCKSFICLDWREICDGKCILSYYNDYHDPILFDST
ncbi:unnamed protein product [Rotaria magnacalcarata]|nr:unnamed protein product [Rotaria magnacalcarata]CAF3928493.1 unnamed protein product [Rotaria magnacalcarata]